MKQRSITELEIEHVLRHPSYIKKIGDGRKEAAGALKGRTIIIIIVEMENYIKVLTLI